MEPDSDADLSPFPPPTEEELEVLVVVWNDIFTELLLVGTS